MTVLEAGEAEWRQLVETLPQIVWITRPDGWHVHFNQQWMDFTGLTLEQSLGFGWNPPFHPEDRERAAARWSQATSSGEPYEIEYRLRRADGVYRWMLGRAVPLRDGSGAIVKWFGTCTDIEELKQARVELDQSRSLQRMAGSMARLGGWSLDVTAGRLVWSEEIYEILEWPTSAVPSLEEALAVIRSAGRARLEAALERCAGSGTPFDVEVELATFTGRHLSVRLIGEARRGADGAVLRIDGAMQDISAVKASSSRNQMLAERLTTTLESITDAFYTLDGEWRFTYVNGRAEALVQRGPEELLGRLFWEEFAPVLGTEIETAYRRAMREGVTVVLDEYYYAPLETWFEVNIYPSEQGLAVYFRDVSEPYRDRQALRRLNEELNSANEQLEDASQLKDDLLSMASHELRTPLTPILGFLEILVARGNLTTDQHQMLNVMGSNAKRMLRLVDDLLVVGGAAAGALVIQPQEVSVETALAGVLDELSEMVGPVDLAVGGCRVVADPHHLEQIAMNLLTNASKYGEPPLVVSAKPAGEGRIAIEIADRGGGIPSDFQEHMWDRFAQKDRGDRRTASGVGLGLSIVKLLAEANDGTVSYRDGSPTGAVFTIELPGVCPPEHPQPGAGSTGDSVPDRGGVQSSRGDGVSPSPRPTGPRPQPHRSPTTATLPATAPEDSAVGGDVDAEQVVAWATRQLLHVESRDEAAGVVLRVIQRLGGWTTPARLADEQALPLDVSFGLSGPILPVAPPHSIERMHLERHLPAVVEDARRAIDVVGSVSRLQHAASIDPLTGLANRRSIDRLLVRGCQGAAVVVIDLDGFKEVNDREGHAAGDRILQHFGGCLRDAIRAADHAGRLGGDEFIAILQDTDETGARQFVERLRQSWLQVREHQVGFSAGLTTVNAGEPATDAIARADTAMYVEKATHRTDGEGR